MHDDSNDENIFGHAQSNMSNVKITLTSTNALTMGQEQEEKHDKKTDQKEKKEVVSSEPQKNFSPHRI